MEETEEEEEKWACIYLYIYIYIDSIYGAPAQNDTLDFQTIRPARNFDGASYVCIILWFDIILHYIRLCFVMLYCI